MKGERAKLLLMIFYLSKRARLRDKDKNSITKKSKTSVQGSNKSREIMSVPFTTQISSYNRNKGTYYKKMLKYAIIQKVMIILSPIDSRISSKKDMKNILYPININSMKAFRILKVMARETAESEGRRSI